MIKLLKKTDRILLEMYTGMVIFGLICQTIGAFFVSWYLRYTESLWFGILFAAVGSTHMAKTLDRALADAERTAKIITAGYVFRYIMLAVILAIVAVTDVLSFPVVFLGYMGMKAAAYLQPLTHKLYNRLFHETDPIPEPCMEEEGTVKLEYMSAEADGKE